jgi:uridine kinase
LFAAGRFLVTLHSSLLQITIKKGNDATYLLLTANYLCRMKSPFVIGIVGGSGSGKTTIMNCIAADYDPKQVCVITLDDYYRPKEFQVVDVMGVEDFDRPESVDLEAFERDLQRVLNGEPVTVKKYAFNKKSANENQTVTYYPAPVIVIEGIFVFYNKVIREHCDLKVFIHTPDHQKLIRRIKRDLVERQYDVNDVMHRYEHHVMPSYKLYIEPYRESADLVLNNGASLEGGYKVLKSYINELLTENPPS